jgi:hypothetical protein
MLEDTLVLRSKISPTMQNKICTGKIYSNNKKEIFYTTLNDQ